MPSKPKKQKTAESSARCVIYARVSSAEQAQGGFSIDSQLGLLREYALRQKFVVDHEYKEAETAKSSGRSHFNHMLAYVAEHPGTVILVEKLDRLTRNFMDMAQIEASGAVVHLVKEGVVYAPESRSSDKLMVGIRAVLAKHFIDNLKEEIRKGMLEKARQGYYPTMAPIGYLNVSRGGKKVIEPDPLKGPLMATLFHEYATGAHSLETIRHRAKELALFGRDGSLPTKSTIHRSLTNPVYAGIVQWNGEVHVGKHEAIVSLETFQKVQDVLAGKTSNAGASSHSFTFRGLLKCAHCGCSVTAEIKKGKYIYYHCTGARNARCEGKRPIPEQRLTEQFSELLDGLTLTPTRLEWLREELRASQAEEKAMADDLLERSHSEEKKIRTQLERLYLDKVAGEISETTYRDLRARFEHSLAECQLRQQSVTRAEGSYFDRANEILELAQNAGFYFKQATSDEKREILFNVLSNCNMRDGRIEFQLQEPFETLLLANRTPVESSTLEIWYSVRDAFRNAARAA